MPATSAVVGNTDEAIDARDHALAHASPVHLRAVAHLCGLEAPRLETARVLELGCGLGRTMQAFALAYPGAKIVGVDIWPDELAVGENEAFALGIKNLQFLPLLCLDIDETFGLFDYIVVRDEYSWAPDAMREALLRVCAQNLAPGGVVYFGFQAYPGGHVLDVVRDAIQLHAHAATSIEEVRAEAGAMLQLMVTQGALDQAYAQEVKQVVHRLSSHPEYYINADFLQRANNASYLIDVVTRAQEQGLVYLSDARPFTEHAKYYGRPTQLQMGLVALGKVWPVRQQYLDFALNRSFRQSLFTRQPVTATSIAGADFDKLKALSFACALKRRHSPALAARAALVEYVLPSGKQHDFDDERTVALLDVLGCIWPNTLSFNDLVAATRYIDPSLDDHAQESAVQTVLESLITADVLRVALGQGPYDVSDASSIYFVADFSSFLSSVNGQKKQVVFNLWGEAQKVSLGGSPAGVVQLFEQLALGDTTRLAKQPGIFKVVEYLRWNGLLKGSDSAWLRYYAAVLNEAGIDLGEKMLLLPAYIGHLMRRMAADPSQRLIPTGAGEEQPTLHMLRELDEFWKRRAFGKLRSAVDEFVRRFPNHKQGWHILALMQSELGEVEEAARNFLRAISVQPYDPNPYVGLVAAQERARGAAMVRVIFGLLTWLKPDHIPAYIHLGNFYHVNELPVSAERCVDHVLMLAPEDPTALRNKAVYLSGRGNIEEALPLLEKIVIENPSDFLMGSNYLYNLSLYEDVTPQALFEAHKRYGGEIARYVKKSGLKFKHRNSRDAERPLKVGFVSGDLRNHAVSRFIEPVWRLMDRSAFKIHVYSVFSETDEMTDKLMSLADRWVLASSLNYENLAKQIHDDEIDILFDLSGHTGHNRLPTFGFKPAPIQITWIGYPGTTGLQAMDYYIFNKHLAPDGLMDWQFTEKIIRMSATATFDPAIKAPDINALPARKNGCFTFGSFNRMNKVNPTVLGTWAEILRKAPGSKLVIGHADRDQEVIMRDMFEKQGVEFERLVFHPRLGLRGYMQLHNEVDMLLDTFPYNGGTTTCYGLWMGVPTLTLAGATVPARTGAAVMGLMGLQDFIARDVDDYLCKAVQLSADLTRLEQIRSRVRGQFTATDSHWRSEAVVENLQNALRQAWRSWCEGKAAQSFTAD